MNVFELVAKLVLDSSNYDEGLGEASKTAQGFGSKLKSGLGTAAKVGGAALGAVTATAGAFATALVSGVNELADFGDGVDKASQKLGISAEAYQEWDAVLQHSGTSMGAMSATFKTLANAAQDASDDQAAAFERLGLSMEEVASMSTEDLFSAVITGLQGMKEGTERTAIATDLLGRGAMEMGALLNTSAEDTQAMRERVHELGGVLSDEGVKSAAAFKDEMQDMQTAISGAKRNIMEQFLPAFSSAMHLIQDLVASDVFKDFGKKIGDIFQHIINLMDKTLIPAFKRMWPSISRIIDDVLDLLDTIMPVLEPIIDGIIFVIENVLIPVIEEIFDAIGTVIKIITGDFSAAVMTLEEATDNLADAENRLKDAQDQLADATDRLKNAQEDLQIAEENAGISIQDLLELIENGTITYDQLSDAQKRLYDAYYDLLGAQSAVEESTRNVETAMHDQAVAAFEVERAAAEANGTLEEFAQSVIEAFEQGEISAEEARQLIEEAMTGMSLSAEVAFLETIPSAIKEGLDPAKYETQASLVKKVFDDLWPQIEQGAVQMYQWIQTNVNEPLSNAFVTLGNTIGNAFSSAWTAITNVFSSLASWFQSNVIDPIANAWSSLLALITGGQSKLDSFQSHTKSALQSSGSAPKMARGGVLERGQVGILEGDGAEAVVPLDQNERWIRAVANDMVSELRGVGGGMTNSIVINVNPAQGQDERAIAEEVDRRLWESINRKEVVFA